MVKTAFLHIFRPIFLNKQGFEFDFHDHHDHFTNSTPESEWKTCLSHAEKIGLGSRDYELVVIK